MTRAVGLEWGQLGGALIHLCLPGAGCFLRNSFITACAELVASVFKLQDVFLWVPLPQDADRLFMVLDIGYYNFGIVASIEPRISHLLGKCSTRVTFCFIF